jgi:hypothetical protein
MGTKIIKERVEQFNLDEYALDTDVSELQSKVTSNDNDIINLQNQLNNLPNDMVRTYTGALTGLISNGTYSYNLASLMGISDPENWKFAMVSSLSGVYKPANYWWGWGWINNNTTWDTYVQSWVSGTTGYVKVASSGVQSRFQVQSIAYRIK